MERRDGEGREMADWVNIGFAGLSVVAAGMSARSASQSRKTSDAMLKLERQRDEEQKREHLRPTFTALLMATTRGAPSAVLIRLEGPQLLAEEFSELKVWITLRESQVPHEKLRRVGTEEQRQERQFWSPWQFDASEERTLLESREHVLDVYESFVALLQPTPRVTTLYDDEEWERRLFDPLLIEINAKLDDMRPWVTPLELPWGRTWS